MSILSSHVLNGVDGTHAAGVPVTLRRLDDGALLFEAATDEGGRLVREVDLAGADPGARYELVLDAAAYFSDPVIEEVVLRLRMPDPEARYHRPVILSPAGYSTWASR